MPTQGPLPSTGAGQAPLASIEKELKVSPAAVTNAARRKFGVDRSVKQQNGKLLTKGRQAGVKIPSSNPASFSK